MTPRRTHALVLDLLRTVGPMTRIELERVTGASRQHLGEVLRDLLGKPPLSGAKRQARGALPRQIRINAWERSTVGATGRFYLRAVYAIGTQRDAPHPGALTGTQIEQRYRAKKRAGVHVSRAVGNSVFNWRP